MTYVVEFHRLGAMAMFDLKGPQTAIADWCGDNLPVFPATPNTFESGDGWNLLFIGRDHWLLIADLDGEAAMDARLRPTEAPPEISLVRVSDTLCYFRISGRDADQIMSIASPLDVHPSVFPENGATFTEAFGLKALVLRETDGFLLAVEQSFGDMLEDYLTLATS